MAECIKHQVTAVCLFLEYSQSNRGVSPSTFANPEVRSKTPTCGGGAGRSKSLLQISLQQKEAPEARYADACVSSCEIQTVSPGKRYRGRDEVYSHTVTRDTMRYMIEASPRSRKAFSYSGVHQ